MENEEYEGSYYAVLPWYVLEADISDSAKVLCGFISAFTTKYGYCTASNELLAKTMGVGERHIQKLLTELTQKGLVTREISKDCTSRRLFINWLSEPQFKGDEPAVRGGTNPQFVGGRTGSSGGLKKENLASSLASPLSSSLNNPISYPTPNSYSLEKKEQQVTDSSYVSALDKGCGEKNTETTEEHTQALFEQFWKAYPRKDSKKAALKAFTRIPNLEGEFPRIMEAVEAAKKSAQWNEDHGKYIPYPATYLNGEKWKDEGTQTQEDKMNEALRGLNSLFGIKEVF